MIIHRGYRSCLKNIFFLLVFTAGCESNLDLNIPDSSPVLTVNCILQDDESVSMSISKSLPYRYSATDTSSFEIVKNATVTFTDNDISTDTLEYKELTTAVRFNLEVMGAYVFQESYKPLPSHSYSIRIKLPGLQEITSSTVLPEPVPILSVDTVTVHIKNGSYSYKVLQITIRFKDPPDKSNYYKVSIDRFGLFTRCANPFDCITYKTKANASFICYDKNAIYRVLNFNDSFIPLENEDQEIWYDELFISDQGFDGKIYELKLHIRPDLFNDWANPPAGEKITNRVVYIRLYSVNEQYYRYSKSYFDQLRKRNDLFSEPVQVYSNISNGTGIFSGASASVDSSIVIPVRYSMPIF